MLATRIDELDRLGKPTLAFQLPLLGVQAVSTVSERSI